MHDVAVSDGVKFDYDLGGVLTKFGAVFSSSVPRQLAWFLWAVFFSPVLGWPSKASPARRRFNYTSQLLERVGLVSTLFVVAIHANSSHGLGL